MPERDSIVIEVFLRNYRTVGPVAHIGRVVLLAECESAGLRKLELWRVERDVRSPLGQRRSARQTEAKSSSGEPADRGVEGRALKACVRLRIARQVGDTHRKPIQSRLIR